MPFPLPGSSIAPRELHLTVEVPPAAEYADEHLPDAVNIRSRSSTAEAARRLDRERPVIVYCHDYQ